MVIRIITALVLAPLFVMLTLWLSAPWFAGFIALILLIGAVEWSQLAKQTTVIGGLAIAVLACFMFALYQNPRWLYLISIMGAVYWLVQIVDLFRNGLTVRQGTWAYLFHSSVVLLAAWSSIVLLHQNTANGPIMAIGFIASVWMADSCAYFAGKAFGRHKLAPQISPGKTIEGVAGGVVGTVLFAGLFCYFAPFFAPGDRIIWVVLAFFAALISVVGDLYESRLKRVAGFKDSGNLLPGHGGMLDRIDGLLAAAPIFVTLLLV